MAPFSDAVIAPDSPRQVSTITEWDVDNLIRCGALLLDGNWKPLQLRFNHPRLFLALPDCTHLIIRGCGVAARFAFGSAGNIQRRLVGANCLAVPDSPQVARISEEICPRSTRCHHFLGEQPRRADLEHQLPLLH